VVSTRELPDFVSALDVDIVLKVSGVADLTGDFHQVRQRLSDRFGAAISDDRSEPECKQSAQEGNDNGCGCRSLVRTAALFDQLLVFLVDRFQQIVGILNPRRRIFLEIENLQLRYSGVAAIDFLAL